MRVVQLVLDVTQEKRSPWAHEFLLPAYLAVALLILQLIIIIWTSRPGLSFRNASSSQTAPTGPLETQGLLRRAKQHFRAQGSLTIGFSILSFLSTITLVCLTTIALLILQRSQEQIGPFQQHKPIEPHALIGVVEIVHLALYVYASVLALITLVSHRWWSIARLHLNVIMLSVAAVYTYRDLLPLTMFNLTPMDSGQGWLLWSRLSIVLFVGVLCPLITPRIYTPVDPLNPEKEVNSELTASWLSFLTYTFMDPLILLAARSSHLAYESLPPLADYDRAEYLVQKSEKILDPYLRRKRTHLFWGLIRFFASEYIRLIIMITLKCLTGFLPPLAVNKVLQYLETGGKDAIVRPWVWIFLLFVGPTLGSISMQYYIFLATRTLVRTEGILTQLVFDHSLRIRMKEETEVTSTPTTVATTPDTRSIAETDATEIGAGSSDGCEDTLQESGNMSTASLAQSVAKGKRKAANISCAISAVPTPGPDGAKPVEAKASNLVGKINNFVSTDLGNITDGRDFLFIAWYGPLQLAICIWFLYAVLGWSALVGMGVMLISVPLPGYVAKLLNGVQTQRMQKTDARVQAVTETLSVIRMIKLFGWETKVNEQIAEKREVELGLLKKRRLLDLLNSNLNYFFPLLTMLVTFACYTIIQKEVLSASKLFSSIAVFDQLRDCLHGTFFMLPMIINAKVSLGRINDFLLNTELLDRFTLKENGSEPDVDPAHTIEPNAIGFRNAAFSWNGVQDQKEDIPTRRLYRLKIEGELFFKRRSLNLIIGPTGSGKTSLLMALLGEMHFEPNGEKAGFRLPRDGGVAYAAQETWVQNETIKVNILFGKPYDKERYDKVVYQCGLERDISLFEAGDETEVGEKGLTLSGGQKARITLARAVYSDAAIILLDDILAALDVHTARFIVEKCLQGDLLKDRTTILVTHNIAMVAPIAHFAVSLSLDGRVVSQGTVSEAMAKNQTFLRQVAETNEITEKVEETVDNVEFNKKDQNAVSKLVMEEEIALGHVGWPALKLYFSSLGGAGFWMAFVGGVFFVELLVNLSTWFLGFWASQYENHPVWAVPVSYYLSMYSVILASTMFVFSVSMVLFVFGSIKASRTIHRKLITSVLGTTLRWLDTVPTARIIARCTQDIRAVDGPLSQHLSDVIEITLALIVKFGAVILFVPMFVLPGLATFVAGGICGQLYIKAQLSVKREMSNRRSPVLAHFGAAISGLTSLRAYGAQNAFKTESLKRINGYTRPARTFYNCNRWVGIRIDAIGGTFAAGLAAYLVYDEGLRTVSNAGFSLTMAVGFSGLVLWWIRVLNEFEVHGNSLERIEDYVEIDQEPQATDAGKPPAYWPASGDLTVENLRARYSADGPEVLHDISFEVRSGERIGVVGRTGSGKSSLTLSLLRCIPTEGRVFYGGLAIHSINLDILRSNITIIPQQPELLSGTLRENLDPFSEHTDATLNDALRAAGLFNLQGENDASKITLDSSVSSGGGNLSVGQRQILALARAIVRRSKLLILDEATSAIDYATDTIIQTTLREVLKDATLITVAHRLQTIMDADKILVLDAGNMVEFDSPANLLKKDDGYLKSLVDESGDRDMLYKMAEKVGCSSK